MDISKARRFVELEKEGRKVLLTLWEGDQITSCVEEQEKKYCETCQCNDELCNSYVEYLKEKGYQATEIELGEAIEETLPKFLEERELRVKPSVVVEVEPTIAVEEEVGEDAVTPADQALS